MPKQSIAELEEILNAVTGGLPKLTAKKMSIAGAAPWKAGPRQMSHWVLVPESFHAKPAELKKWAAKAHGLCSAIKKGK